MNVMSLAYSSHMVPSRALGLCVVLLFDHHVNLLNLSLISINDSENIGDVWMSILPVMMGLGTRHPSVHPTFPFGALCNRLDCQSTYFCRISISIILLFAYLSLVLFSLLWVSNLVPSASSRALYDREPQ